MLSTLTKFYCSSLLIFAFFNSAQAFSIEKPQLQTTEVDFFDQANQRPTKVKFWYQSNALGCAEKICLSAMQNNQRVAIISHGAFGSPRSMNWLGYALASQGWVVAGVAHYGESWVYGTQTIDPSVLSRFWQRPQEVSFVIDSFAEKGLFNTPLNTDKVIMLGHSSGGFTTLALAGAQLEAGKSEAYCASYKSKSDKGCNYGVQGQRKPLNDEMLNQIAAQQAQMQDPRISAVIALDPALGHAVNDQSLRNVQIPTLIIGSVDNDFLPFNAHAKYYANHIQRADLVGIEQGAGHFVYLDECDNNREVKGVPLCKDKKGVNRQMIHKQVLNHIFGFIYSKGLS